MRSGNGRHRRPRQVPAMMVTAGVTGSALALPLLAAGQASAAPTATWDKVAECESGGTWSSNSGSGAYGGLQFTAEQWHGAGGRDFAERPDLASRSQQIAVAERVLAAQGPQVWQECGARAGLSAQGPAADVDPGLPGGSGPVAPSPTRPDHAVPTTGSGTPSTDFGAPTPGAQFPVPEGPLAPDSGLPVMPEPDAPTTSPTLPGVPAPSPDPTAPGLPADPTAPPVPGGSLDPTAPATPGTPTTPSVPGTPSVPAVPGAPADATLPAEGSGKHRGPAADEAPGAPDAASGPTYQVKAGDSLTAIADARGLKGGWNELYAANEQVIGGNADLIKPGQNLDLNGK
ncbi:transglycosylase family protein [Streptomyces sp. NPDC051567]|uniref:LysM peptidoglycan-binding domain-containing protein n=1 Tax=Streptomyces sp. NPDC051567 TaxID=3365660 RepID=UPI0037A7164B